VFNCKFVELGLIEPYLFVLNCAIEGKLRFDVLN
jgi:hypothetical protein